MGSLTVDALFRGLRSGAIEPVYYLYGAEDALKDDAIRELSERVLEPSTRDFNYDEPDPAGVDAERLDALLNTPPMLADRRLVVLRGLTSVRKRPRVREALLRYASAPNPSSVLVLVDYAPAETERPAKDKSTEALKARALSVDCARLPPERAARWAANRASRLDLTLEPAAAAHLVEALESDLGLIAQELEKLATAVSGRAATRADVESLIGVRHGETLPILVAAALERRAVDAAQLVDPVLSQPGMSGVRVVMALGTALVGTALARAELDRGTPAARLEGVVFRHILATRPPALPAWKETAAQWAEWARRWRQAELRAALAAALAADRALKSTRLSREAGIVTELVLSWAALPREAA